MKDNITEEILIANYFAEDIYEVLRDLFAHEIYPIIYSYQNNIENETLANTRDLLLPKLLSGEIS